MKKKAEKKTQAEELPDRTRERLETVIAFDVPGELPSSRTRTFAAPGRSAGGNYKVVKNTVAERAAAGTPTEGLLKNLKGTNSIAYTKTDPVALAKILTKVAKDTPAFQFRAGWVEGRVISIQEIGQLALLPSKEELISKVMFLLNAPAQRP